MGTELWYPLWSEDSVPTTAAALAKLIGRHGRAQGSGGGHREGSGEGGGGVGGRSLPPTPTPTATATAAGAAAGAAVIAVPEPDYPAAWAALHDPVRLRDPAGLADCVAALGMSEPYDLALADDAVGALLKQKTKKNEKQTTTPSKKACYHGAYCTGL